LPTFVSRLRSSINWSHATSPPQPGLQEAEVQIVWDPPWNQSMITDAGKKRLGIW
jgi:metal-sulfur cluster biosynthetic enzyme